MDSNKVYKNRVELVGKFGSKVKDVGRNQSLYDFYTVRKFSETVDNIPIVIDLALESTIKVGEVYTLDGQLRSHDIDGLFVTVTGLSSGYTDLYRDVAEIEVKKIVAEYEEYTVERGTRKAYRIRFSHPIYNKVYYARMVIWDKLLREFQKEETDEGFIVKARIFSRKDKYGRNHVELNVFDIKVGDEYLSSRYGGGE